MGYIYIGIDDQELGMVRCIYIAIYTRYRACCECVWHGKRRVVYKHGVGSLHDAEE